VAIVVNVVGNKVDPALGRLQKLYRCVCVSRAVARLRVLAAAQDARFRPDQGAAVCRQHAVSCSITGHTDRGWPIRGCT
jgi:hypothetical protein